jgi:hypothetical protein
MGTDYVFHDSNPPGTVRTREPEKRGLSLIFPLGPSRAAELHSAQRIPHPGPPTSSDPRKERHQSPANRHQAQKPKRAGQSAGVVQPKIMTGIKNTQRARPQADDWGLSPRRSWPNVLRLGSDRESADGGEAWRCCRWTGD